MFVVGLTGGIASGKSTVLKIFEAEGVPVICLDELARAVVRPGAPALEDIRATFGEEFINSDGELDRDLMAGVVFRDPEKRRVLESITHPRIMQEASTLLRFFEQSGHSIVVEDVPLLYEIGFDKWCDVVVVVYVPKEVQERRLIERDRMTPEHARARIASQMPIEEKKRRADYVIDNTGDPESTRRQALEVLERIRAQARSGKGNLESRASM
ncbi:MAG: dephospho-CoA kinase [Desulfomonile sp.]|nr:dephospho-CoA kinase [Desulfomonile sp.]